MTVFGEVIEPPVTRSFCPHFSQEMKTALIWAREKSKADIVAILEADPRVTR